MRLLQGVHLRLLKLAHAPLRGKHKNRDCSLITHGVLGRASRIARGGSKNIKGLPLLLKLILKELAQKLHRHILKGHGWTVRQLK